MHITRILKYYKVKKSRWKWEHRFYDDMYSEIYDKLHKENPSALHENIRKALKRTATILPKKVFSPKHGKYLRVKLYALSPTLQKTLSKL